MSHEGISFTPKPEIEQTPEMSAEDFAEMLDQIPALKEMLEKRTSELKALENNPDLGTERIAELRVEIEELQAEIVSREEVV